MRPEDQPMILLRINSMLFVKERALPKELLMNSQDQLRDSRNSMMVELKPERRDTTS